jgi:hypothetical protein
VLDQVRQRRPGDFAALTRLVRRIVPVSAESLEKDPGTLGEWKQCPDELLPWDPAHPDPVHVRPSGVVELLDEEHEDVVATVAYEFGHVCTRHEDLWRRGGPSDEWRSELAADWYAYRWGFGRAISRSRKRRKLLHHLGGPGDVVEVDGCRFRITRSLCLHPVGRLKK